MKASLFNLLIILGGGLFVAPAMLVLPLRSYLFNYRQVGLIPLFWLISLAALYLLGVYITAILLRFARPRQQQQGNWQRILLRLCVPAALTATLAIALHSGFPGNFATAEVRQRWAYTEFSHYDAIVKQIKQCAAIRNRIGNVSTIAPTQGRNVTVFDPGSSGHRGEFTLETIGTQGTGIVNFQFAIETSANPIGFTHNNQTERLNCHNNAFQ